MNASSPNENTDSCCSTPLDGNSGENSSPVRFKLPETPKTTISIDPQKCVGCGVCAEVCAFCLPQSDEFGFFIITESEKCVGCSACSRNCPVDAIYLEEQVGCGCIWCDDTTNECCS